MGSVQVVRQESLPSWPCPSLSAFHRLRPSWTAARCIGRGVTESSPDHLSISTPLQGQIGVWFSFSLQWSPFVQRSKIKITSNNKGREGKEDRYTSMPAWISFRASGDRSSSKIKVRLTPPQKKPLSTSIRIGKRVKHPSAFPVHRRLSISKAG